jgi:hypothetical protein
VVEEPHGDGETDHTKRQHVQSRHSVRWLAAALVTHLHRPASTGARARVARHTRPWRMQRRAHSPGMLRQRQRPVHALGRVVDAGEHAVLDEHTPSRPLHAHARMHTNTHEYSNTHKFCNPRSKTRARMRVHTALERAKGSNTERDANANAHAHARTHAHVGLADLLPCPHRCEQRVQREAERRRHDLLADGLRRCTAATMRPVHRGNDGAMRPAEVIPLSESAWLGAWRETARLTPTMSTASCKRNALSVLPKSHRSTLSTPKSHRSTLSTPKHHRTPYPQHSVQQAKCGALLQRCAVAAVHCCSGAWL